MSGKASLRVEPFTEAVKEEWDSYVRGHPEGRYSQLSGYREVVKRTYSYQPCYYLFRDASGRIAALLPAFIKGGWPGGRKLVSQPFCEYGGLLGRELSEEESSSLKEHLLGLLQRHRLPYFEVHAGLGLPLESQQRIFTLKRLHHYAVLALASRQELWEKRVDYSVQKAVRKAQRGGLVCYQETTESSIAKDFYPLYLHSMKRFGTPPHPRAFFLNCLRYLGQEMKLFLVKEGERTVAALMGFTTGLRAHIVSTVSREEDWEKRPNDLAHWEFIRWAAKSGYRTFDFGPVRYEGQRRYKEKWGVEMREYHYLYLLRKGKVPGEAAYSVGARALAYFWRKLVPLGLTPSLGPPFRRILGD